MEKKINIRLIFTLLLCRDVLFLRSLNIMKKKKKICFTRICLEFSNVSFNMSIFFDQ